VARRIHLGKELRDRHRGVRRAGRPEDVESVLRARQLGTHHGLAADLTKAHRKVRVCSIGISESLMSCSTKNAGAFLDTWAKGEATRKSSRVIHTFQLEKMLLQYWHQHRMQRP
jgi:hypothetical protein